jgi:hypothetical protein
MTSPEATALTAGAEGLGRRVCQAKYDQQPQGDPARVGEHDVAARLLGHHPCVHEQARRTAVKEVQLRHVNDDELTANRGCREDRKTGWSADASEAELDELDTAARAHLQNPHTITMYGPLFLVWARRSA